MNKNIFPFPAVRYQCASEAVPLWQYQRNEWLTVLPGYLFNQAVSDCKYNKVVIFVIQLIKALIRSTKDYTCMQKLLCYPA